MLCLNETAAWLWQKAQESGDFTVESLSDALCDEYEVDKAQALADVKETIDNWISQGVVE